MLNSVILIIVMEALFREIRSGYPEKLLYTDDLTLVSETFEGPKGRLGAWKGDLGSKGLRVNVKKTKMMITSENP